MKKTTTWLCDGTEINDYDGHPRVYLYEHQNCPYCGRLSITNAIKEGLNGLSKEDLVGIDDEENT